MFYLCSPRLRSSHIYPQLKRPSTNYTRNLISKKIEVNRYLEHKNLQTTVREWKSSHVVLQGGMMGAFFSEINSGTVILTTLLVFAIFLEYQKTILNGLQKLQQRLSPILYGENELAKNELTRRLYQDLDLALGAKSIDKICACIENMATSLNASVNNTEQNENILKHNSTHRFYTTDEIRQLVDKIEQSSLQFIKEDPYKSTQIIWFAITAYRPHHPILQRRFVLSTLCRHAEPTMRQRTLDFLQMNFQQSLSEPVSNLEKSILHNYFGALLAMQALKESHTLESFERKITEAKNQFAMAKQWEPCALVNHSNILALDALSYGIYKLEERRACEFDQSEQIDLLPWLVDHFKIICDNKQANSAEAAAYLKLLEAQVEVQRELQQNKSGEKPIFALNTSQIAGYEEEIDQLLREVFLTRTLPKQTGLYGIAHTKGAILYGPPGTGKTLIARIISQAYANVKIVNGPELQSKWIGESERFLRELFAPAVKEWKAKGEDSKIYAYIFDEIDSLFPGGGFYVGHNARQAMTAQLLTLLDGVDSPKNVIVIGTTNCIEALDPALLRPGRLEVKIKIGLPNESQRLAILNLKMKTLKGNYLLSSDVDLKAIARAAKGYSGADLEGVVKRAVQLAMDENFQKTGLKGALTLKEGIKSGTLPLQKVNQQFLKMAFERRCAQSSQGAPVAQSDAPSSPLPENFQSSNASSRLAILKSKVENLISHDFLSDNVCLEVIVDETTNFSEAHMTDLVKKSMEIAYKRSIQQNPDGSVLQKVEQRDFEQAIKHIKESMPDSVR